MNLLKTSGKKNLLRRSRGPMRTVSGWRIACLHVKGWRLCGGSVAPPTQEVGRTIVLGVWWSGTDIIVCILILLRLCCVSGNVCGLPVGFRWSVNFSWRVGVLEEQDGVVLGVYWPLPSDLDSFQSLEYVNEHFQL